MEIKFEPTAFAVDEWRAGKVIIDEGIEPYPVWEETYPFTLFVSSDNGVMEVTWTEKTPIKDVIDIETRIKQKYLAR